MSYANLIARILLTSVQLFMLESSSAATTEWPKIALPPATIPYSISDEVAINGMPTRWQGFFSSAKPDALAAWFQAHMKQALVQTRLGDRHILGRPMKGFYVTIELAPARQGTHGLLAISNLAGGGSSLGIRRALHDRDLAKFPDGSRILASLTSSDRGKLSSMIAVSNAYSELQNRDHLIRALHEDGLSLERQSHSAGLRGGEAMFFKGYNKEAVAVIRRGRDGQASVVLNIVSNLDNLK